MSFTIRIYGLLIHKNRILLSRENIHGTIYTKFPGGGLEYGEGIIDCLKREFREEAGIDLTETYHFYTTEDFIRSAFHSKPTQVLSIYYKVKTEQFDQIETGNPEQTKTLVKDQNQILYWCSLEDLSSEPLELPIDKIVVKMLSTELTGET